jgi:hypothetical protein
LSGDLLAFLDDHFMAFSWHFHGIFMGFGKNQSISGWLVVWNMFYFSSQLGISSSQLTNSIIFQRGSTNQLEFAMRISGISGG